MSAGTGCSLVFVPQGTNAQNCATWTIKTCESPATGKVVCFVSDPRNMPCASPSATSECCGNCCCKAGACAKSGSAAPMVWSATDGGTIVRQNLPVLSDLMSAVRLVSHDEAKPAGQGAAAPAPNAPGGPILGVQLGEVSDILNAQLDLHSGQAVTVLNIVKGSPAERAGIQRYDIITTVNGKKVEGGVGKVAESIGAMKAGDRVAFDVVRQGRPIRIEAVLAERQGNPDWKFDFTPETMSEDALNVRGRVIRPDDSGAWIVEDLDDLDDDVVKGLPDALRRWLPQGQNQVQQFFVDGDRKSIRVERSVDGNSMVIEQGTDGAIDVVRKAPGAADQSAHYNNRDGLRQADPEAADLLEGVNVHVFSGFNGLTPPAPPAPPSLPAPPLPPAPPSGAMGPRGGRGLGAPRASDDLHERLRDAEDQLRNALKDLDREWGGMGNDGAWREQLHNHLEALNDLFRDRGMVAPPVGMGGGRARQSFRSNPDGSIEVTIRKDDSEIVRTFRNAQELEKNDPRLYEKYRSMMDNS